MHLSGHSQLRSPSSENCQMDIENFLRNEGLPIPSLDQKTWNLFQKTKNFDFVWSTRFENQDPYDVQPFLQEIQDKVVQPYTLIGLRGHGVHSWFYHIYMVNDSFALFLQMACGSMNRMNQPIQYMEGILGIVADMLIPKIQSNLEQGYIKPKQRIVILQSDRIGYGAWTWQNFPGRSIDKETWCEPKNLWRDVMDKLTEAEEQ